MTARQAAAAAAAGGAGAGVGGGTGVAGMEKEGEVDDEGIPDLVENFEEAEGGQKGAADLEELE